MASGTNELLVSAASVWELSIKQSVGELRVSPTSTSTPCDRASPNCP
ncbi:MAG: hypothetical protein ACRDRK_05675 [Pseudonocardia sp.]